MSLQKQIDEMNWWAKMKDKPEMDINALSNEEAQSIYIHIDTGLSPENLCCDGEISRSAANAKYRAYHSAIKELNKRGFVAQDCYEF
jgi:hypothetical protein